MPNGIIDATKTIQKVFEFHLRSSFIKYASTMYATNNNPCGIPNILTYDSSLPRYLIGTAINNRIKYDNPSKILTILNIDFMTLKFRMQKYNLIR